ncbi:hypothetical protein [Bradyrhizobium sp. LHD-71]|uniref:hypothetical protein n=1 Tax=Bradyrhizobium sp. LHD-71 TaxID=3072141 RepID=UPI0028108A88|nr:hypothetical protein [Bradyrhizobium sp. LHD-71]MDQ8729416.1 hypothetical protein [Bradyrhizobium sp. LHD-71]
MKKLIISLVAGCVGLSSVAANATTLTLTSKIVDNGWEKVRMNCDQFGRCWKERGPRNALLDSYNYAPPRPGAFAPTGSVRIGPSFW